MTDENAPFHNPFGALGALGALRDTLPASPVPIEATPPAPAGPGAAHVRGIARAVVRMERSGRGGKEATVIEQLHLTAAGREAWLKALKAALGCGGSIEGDTLMLQGDQRERLPKLLQARGVKRVTVA